MKNYWFYRGLIMLAFTLATGEVCSATPLQVLTFQATHIERGSLPVLAADDHSGFNVDPSAPRYPGKIGSGLHPSNGGIGSVPTSVGGAKFTSPIKTSIKNRMARR